MIALLGAARCGPPPHRPLPPQERPDPEVPGDVLELEMDELNRHECMAPMAALVRHMQRLQATRPEEVPGLSRGCSVGSQAR